MMRPQPRTPSIRRQAPVLAALLAGLVAAMATSTPAFAQEAAPGAGGIAGYGLWDWLSLVVRIGAVLLVIWASVLAMRWYVRRMNGEAGGRSARQLQIVETRALGPNRALHLVRLGDRAVLIGATAERINALMSIDDPDEVGRLLDGDDVPASSPAARNLSAGLASLASLASAGVARLRASAAQRRAGHALDSGFAPRQPVLDRSASMLVTALTRLGRAMHRAVEGRSTAAGVPAGPQPRIRRAGASLFDRTLAAAEAAHHAPSHAPPPPPLRPAAQPRPDTPAPAPAASLSLGIRARDGYRQAAPTVDVSRREERISALQRAIDEARDAG